MARRRTRKDGEEREKIDKRKKGERKVKGGRNMGEKENERVRVKRKKCQSEQIRISHNYHHVLLSAFIDYIFY